MDRRQHRGGGEDDKARQLAIGARWDGTMWRHSGAVYLYAGPLEGALAAADADASWIAASAGQGVGYAVASAGDLDGDGAPDLFIWAPYT